MTKKITIDFDNRTLTKIVYRSFKEQSKPKNISNILFIDKNMNEVFKDVKADLLDQGFNFTLSSLKMADKFFRKNNIQSVKEI
tara:strand:+ start:4546 stop:4794 length:249 start_codon:yes stop_codon:yes gene_type:complete